MPTLVEFSKLLLPAIEKELHEVVDQTLSPETQELHYMLAYHLGWEGEGAGIEAQGKRIRPLLLLLTVAALGGRWESALPAAAAVELIHNFSLIHDDIQDRSSLRHGRPTLWVKWNIAQAINAGDTMFSQAQLAVLKLQTTASYQVAWEAARMLNRTCVELTQGQYLDLSYEIRQNVSLEDYWLMIQGKTAALLAACTGLGAMISGSSADIQAASHDFGQNLGLAFQVLDDILGIWGKTGQIGKSIESDLVSGKKTLPVLFGLSQKGDFAARWNAGPIAAGEVPGIVELLTKEGVLAYAQKVSDQLTKRALKALERAVLVKSEASAALEELAQNLLQRQS